MPDSMLALASGGLEARLRVIAFASTRRYRRCQMATSVKQGRESGRWQYRLSREGAPT